ncbi:MAG: Fic family protein [Methylocystis sp.]
MKATAQRYFDINKIRENYNLVIDEFDRINEIISCKRDKFDSFIARNMLHAYHHLNKHFAANPGGVMLSWKELLELNMLVHLGADSDRRNDYYGFVKHTEERFEERFPPVMKWFDRHEHQDEDPYKIAAGLYVRILSQPQLFIEGNHRTGSLVANYYLMLKGQNPFVMTVENAVEFLNLASDVKFTSEDIGSRFKRAIGWRDELARMRDFLSKNTQAFTTDVMPRWTPDLYEQQETEDVRKLFGKRKPSPHEERKHGHKA